MANTSAATKRKRASYQYGEYYGMVFRYFVSKKTNNGKDKYILNICLTEWRVDTSDQVKIVLSKEYTPGTEIEEGFLYHLPIDTISEACHQLLVKARKRAASTNGNLRKYLTFKLFSEASLGFLLTAHRYEIVNQLTAEGNEVSTGMKKDREKAIRTLIKKEGHTVWEEVKPEECRAWLSNLSEHAQKQCAAVMRALHRIGSIINHQYVPENYWTAFAPYTYTPVFKTESYRRKYLRMKQLNDAQIAAILERLCGERSKATLTGLAILMIMTMAVTPEELCALTHREICRSEAYDGRYIGIFKNQRILKHGSQNYTTEKSKANQVRCLPLPYVVGKYYEACVKNLHGRMKKNNLTQDIHTLPVFTLQSNIERFRRPDELKKAIEKQLNQILRGKDSIRNQPNFSDGKGQGVSPVGILSATARSKLLQSGLDTDACRYFFGHVPESMAARCYIDPASEAEQCRIGCIIDRWLMSTGAKVQLLSPITVDPNDGSTRVVRGENSRAGMRITITIKPISHRNVKKYGAKTLMIGAKHGLSGGASAR